MHITTYFYSQRRLYSVEERRLKKVKENLIVQKRMTATIVGFVPCYYSRMKMALSRRVAVFQRRRKMDEERMEDACEAKYEYMIHNGALLLQKQISTGHGKGYPEDFLYLGDRASHQQL